MLGRMLACVAFFVRFIVSVFAKAEQAFGAPRRLCFERCEDRNLLAGGGVSSGVVDSYDLDGNGRVEALDVAVGVNDINRNYGARWLDPMSGRITDLMDPNHNGWRDPGDILAVVNRINAVGPYTVVYNYQQAVHFQYDQLGPITVAPGAKDVVVVSGTITSSDGTTFLNHFSSSLEFSHSTLTINGNQTIGNYNGWTEFNFGTSAFVLPAGVPQRFELRADMSEVPGSYVCSFMDFDISAFPGATASMQYDNGNDRVVTVSQPQTHQSFAIALDGGTPLSQVVAGNQSVAVAKFKMTAVASEYTVQEVKLSVPSNSSAVIIDAQLSDGNTVLSSVVFNSTDGCFYFTGLNFVVPANTSKSLTVRYDLAVPLSDLGTSGLNVAPRLSYIRAFDSRGLSTELAPIGLKGNDLYVYKSVPTFTQVLVPNVVLSNWNGSSVWLDAWNVSASQYGEVGLKQMTFDVKWRDLSDDSNLSMSDFRVLRDGVDITSSVMIYDEDGRKLNGTESACKSTSKVYVIWNPLEVVPAGTTVRYLLKATPHGFQHTNGVQADDGISIQPTMDSAVNVGKYVYWTNTSPMTSLVLASKNGTNQEIANIVWTDLSSLVQDPFSGDFANGYLLPGANDLAVKELFGE